MPEDLRNAHTANDKAVMKAYGFKPSMTEPEDSCRVIQIYEVKLKELEQEEKKKEEKSKDKRKKAAPARLTRPNTTQPALTTRAGSVL